MFSRKEAHVIKHMLTELYKQENVTQEEDMNQPKWFFTRLGGTKSSH